MRKELKKATYALVGTGELAVDKAKELAGKARSRAKEGRKDLRSFYRDMSKRGERLMTKARRSPRAERAVEGTKKATRQLKGAATSLRKAVQPEEETPKAKKAS